MDLVVEIALPDRAPAGLRVNSPPDESGLAQDVLDAFEAGGQRLEIGSGPDGSAARIEARFEVQQIVPAGRHGGVDFVVSEAANIAEIEFDAIFEEFGSCGRRRRSAWSSGTFMRPSTMILTTPWAARRRANGSREPVGIMPTPKQPRRVSSLSARETSWPVGVRGIESSMLSGL